MKKQSLAAVSSLAASSKSLASAAIARFPRKVTMDGVSRAYAVGVAATYGLLLMADPASAQSLRSATESVFNEIYGVVGAVGGIAVVGSALNWKAGNLLGAQDPKKTFFHSLIGTGLAFASVGIVQFVKTASGSGASISGI